MQAIITIYSGGTKIMSNYPRVTEILRATESPEQKERLRKWQHAQRAKGIDPEQISKSARENGTNFHSAIANYLTRGEVPVLDKEAEMSRWGNAEPYLKVIKPDLLAVESEVWSDKFGYVGHLDCLAWVSNTLTVIDWKTSSRIKKRAWIDDYFIQGAAYALAAYECGVAPQMPEEIQIYIMSSLRTQVFTEPTYVIAPAWLARLKAYQAIHPLTVA
jgi:genome maintenance exonuclease 1